MGWDEATIGMWLSWARALDPEDAARWRELGVDAETAAWYEAVRPTIADDWDARGFTVEEMVRCHRSRVTMALALEWRAAGRSLDDTVHWASHGFTPAEADRWRAAGHDVRSAHARRRLIRAGDQRPTHLFVLTGIAPLREPIDVPDDARDRKAELAEMRPHLRDPGSLPALWASADDSDTT
jgi:hypothetical protein